MKIVTTRLLRRYGFRRVLLVNETLTALTIGGCAALTPSTPYTVIAIVIFASGLTRSLQFSALNSLAFADVPPEQTSATNTLANVVQQLTLGFGIAARSRGGASRRAAASWRCHGPNSDGFPHRHCGSRDHGGGFDPGCPWRCRQTPARSSAAIVRRGRSTRTTSPTHKACDDMKKHTASRYYNCSANPFA